MGYKGSIADSSTDPDYRELRVATWDQDAFTMIQARYEADGWRLENSFEAPESVLGSEKTVLCFRRIISLR